VQLLADGKKVLAIELIDQVREHVSSSLVHLAGNVDILHVFSQVPIEAAVVLSCKAR
jgi:hypothetical protein